MRPRHRSPEIDYVLRSEIEEVGVKIGCYRMPLERDEHFKANKTLGEYADGANEVVKDRGLRRPPSRTVNITASCGRTC